MIETQEIEWKQDWRDDYLKSICGFANASGGQLVIGKDDNGNIIGLDNPKKLLEELPNKIKNYLGIICNIHLKKEGKKPYIVIDVKQHNNPISFKGRYYCRSGSTIQELQGSELSEFLFKKAGKTWDDVIEPAATIDDIRTETIDLFINFASESERISFEKNNEDLNSILTNLSLINNNQYKRAAILLFGKNTQRFYINSYIKIGKFGKTSDELIFQETIEGNLFELASKTIDTLNIKFLIKKISYKGLQRIEQWEYPKEALREAIINAIIHKDYNGAPIQIKVFDDKIIIWNEGKLPKGLTIEDLKRPHFSKPPNPILANAFFKAGLIEAWGRGTIKIFNECKKAKLPEPSFEYESGGIKVVLFKNILSNEKLIELGLNNRQIKAIEYLKEKKKITNSNYQKLNSVSKATATRDLKELLEKYKLIDRTGQKGVGTIYKLKGS